MTLEDFFTLSEMKDGLTALSRVEELVTVMQKEKDCSVKNVGDASRQWTAVASTIAATDDKDCLDLFIQLEGLLFIDKWLKDAQKFCADREESFLEESIITLLRAIEKLHINNEKSISSGIWVTVKDLCEHKSSTVQDRARILFDCWEQGKDDSAVNCEVEETVTKVEVSVDDRSSKLALGDLKSSATTSNPTSEDPFIGETSMAEPSGELMSPNVSSDLQPERGGEVKIDAENNRLSTPRRVNSAELNERPDLASSIVSSSVPESPCPMEDSSAANLGETPAGISFTTPKGDTAVEKRDLPVEGRFSELDMQADKIEDSVSSPPESKVALSEINAEDSHDLTRQPAPQNKSEANKSDGNKKDSGADCVMSSASDSKDDTVEDGEFCSEAIPGPSLNGSVVGEGEGLDKVSMLKDLGTNDEDKGSDGDESSDDEDLDFRNAFKFSKPVMDSKQSLQGSSLNGSRVTEDEDLDKVSKQKDLGTYDDKDDDDSSDEEDLDFRNAYKFSKPVIDTKRSDTIHKRRSDVELDYGVDPLEVARQVAKAVEREVGDPKGTFCSSSSEKTSDDGLKEQPGSPDSINEEQEQPFKIPTQEVTTTPQVLPAEEETNVGNQDRAKPDDCNHNPDFSQVTKAAQEITVIQERGFCDFDLNDDVCSDEMENPVNPVSTTISVSASRPTTAPGFPAAPLQFEGTLGWKGSARTSAFRPASPRRNSDADKNASVAGTSDGSSKQRQGWLDFDLNVAEDGGDDLAKQIPTLFSGRNHLSGESSVEASPKKSERFNLDLNSTDDGGDVLHLPSSSRLEARHIFNRNGLRSPSPSSSSSSMRNFDLNDRPSFNDPPPLQDHFKPSLLTVNAFPVPKQDNSSVISIMGTRVEINKRDTAAAPQSFLSSLSNGKAIVEPAVDSATAMMTGTGSFLGLAPAGLYTHSQPVFGYNGLTSGPAMSLSSSLYGPGGPIHLMDSRAATMMMPQLVPSASLSSVQQYSQQPPYMMSMANNNPHPSLNGAGPSRPNFDLNSGFMIDAGANSRETGLKQFFVPGPPGRPMEEHLRASNPPPPPASSSSSGGGKRKEPDSGWEGFQFSYKHHQQQPPWR